MRRVTDTLPALLPGEDAPELATTDVTATTDVKEDCIAGSSQGGQW